MKRLTTPFAAAVAVAIAAGALATGCGGSSGASGESAKPGPRAAMVAVASSPLGRILVDGQGRTLYLFQADKGSNSMCYGECALAWPPLTTDGAPKAGKGAVSAELGTTKRDDRTTQVTYNGHPLYTYGGDSGPGQRNGEGDDAFGALWYAVSPAGRQVVG